jgi:apolipoprotein N-acyltransferase
LAYPRPGWDLLGWVALAPLLALAATAPGPGTALREGWFAGLAFFVPLLRWLTHTMTTYSTLRPPLAVLVLLLLSAYLAFFWAVVTAAVAWTTTGLGVGALWLAPAFWVAGELLRTYLLSGFPWGLLGYVPYRRLPIIQVAAWTGVYGVSALLVLVNAALAHAALARAWRTATLSLAAGGLIVGGAWALGAARVAPARSGAGSGPQDRAGVVVALVQGDIPQAVKWDQTFRAETLRVYAELTHLAAPSAQVVVWPEAAVPAFVRHEPAVLGEVVDLARAVGTPLLVGAPDSTGEGRATRYLNSAFLVTGEGLQARYDKMHLVPFGEYVPLKRLLFFVEAIAADIGDFTPGRVPVVFSLPGAPFGTVICYEVIFPNLFRQFVREGASFMVNITNDAWFGDSGGPLQHLAMVPLRAVENGVAVARAANTGVSAFVAPSGAIGPALPLELRGFLRERVALRRESTFYTRHGDLFAYAMTAVSATALVAAGRGRAG